MFNTEQRTIPPSFIHTERKRKFSLTHAVYSLIFLLVHWSFSLSLLLSLGVNMPLRVSFSLTRKVKRDYWYLRPWSHLPSAFTPMAASQCINGDTNTNTENGSEPILCINICITIDTMLNFYRRQVWTGLVVKNVYELKYVKRLCDRFLQCYS